MKRIRIYDRPSMGDYGLTVFEQREDMKTGQKKILIASPLEMKEVLDHDSFGSHGSIVTFRDRDHFQELMDDLWQIGLRPTARSAESRAEVDAVRSHLNDMRALVFKDNRKDL